MLIIVKVIPNSSQDKIVEWEGDVLKIKCKAPPEKGKANAAIISLLAIHYGVPKNSIKILKGKSNSKKLIKIEE